MMDRRPPVEWTDKKIQVQLQVPLTCGVKVKKKEPARKQRRNEVEKEEENYGNSILEANEEKLDQEEP